MHTFQDGNGKEWPVKVTVGTFWEYEERTGVDLLTAIADFAATADPEKKTADLSKLATMCPNAKSAATLIWCAIPQAQRPDNPRDFANLLAGQTLDDAVKALLGELADFSPTLGTFLRSGASAMMGAMTMKDGPDEESTASPQPEVCPTPDSAPSAK